MTGFPEASRGQPRSFRRPLALGLLASVAVHAAAFAVARTASVPSSPPRAAAQADPAEPDGWASSRRALRAVRVADAREVEVPPPPQDVRAEPADVREPGAASVATLASSGLEARGFRRPSYGTRGAERGSTVRPPVPRSVLPEWDPPDDVRGTTVTIRVRVDSAGRPVGPVRLRPETSSSGFNRRLTQKVLEMRFSPARTDGGRPVEAWAELTFTF